ncbi:MAG: histidinol-phosphate transaminase [Verrucomicrobiales bacterium]|nr:histidinol-phosphate transaminase [Verrucomicrobiales bacterium]|tara:strand:- start:2164 stop:3228 length:1065 start_codon:yes stop_codon:yes gene_type:complete
MNLIRRHVRKLAPYVPGEQPKGRGLVKLNTNENPYSPSPKVLKAVRAAVDGRLRLYPNPAASELRARLADLHGCGVENVIVGNGSDELLALATRAFVEPGKGVIQYFTPSYSLYPVLAEIHNGVRNEVPLEDDFSLPVALKKSGWKTRACLSFVTTPNAPSGCGYATERLENLCKSQKGVVVLDEAYADFAEEDALELGLRFSNILVSRTFSKGYSLCFQRVGYLVGSPGLIAALDRIRDSYNVNGLGQVAALATLRDLAYYRKNFRLIKQIRSVVAVELEGLGFEVLPSSTNFLFVKPPRFAAKTWLNKLRERKVLVRWFSDPRVKSYLRITIGSEQEMKALLRAACQIIEAS